MTPRWPFVSLLIAVLAEVFVSASGKGNSSSSSRPKVNRPKARGRSTNLVDNSRSQPSKRTSKGKDLVEKLRPVAVGPRPRHFSGRVVAIPWWDIFLRYHLTGALEQLPNHVQVTPVFSSHYEIMAMPVGTFSVDLSSPISYWQLPDPLELPVGDYDIVISYLNDKNNAIMEHVMEINVSALEIEVPREPIPLEKSKTIIKIGLRNLTMNEMKCIRLLLIRYQPGKDLTKPEYRDVLRDFSSLNVSNLKPGEYRLLDTQDTSFDIDPAFFGALESGLYYIVAFDIAPRPSSIIDVEKELKRREDERINLRGIKILKRVKKHMVENPGVPLYVSDSDSEAEQELKEEIDPISMKNHLKEGVGKYVDQSWIDTVIRKENLPNFHVPAVEEERRARWQRILEKRRRELEREVERTKEYVSFVLGVSHPFHLYTPNDLKDLQYHSTEKETFVFPNSNSCLGEGKDFTVILEDKRIKSDMGKAVSLEMDGMLCRNARRDLYFNQISAAPSVMLRRDGPLELNFNYYSIKTGNVSSASSQTNFISSTRILPQFHDAAVLGEPFPFLFKVSCGLRDRSLVGDHLFFKNAKVELSIPNCIISTKKCATSSHYRVLAQVPVNFDDKELFTPTSLIGVNIIISACIIPKEVIGGRNFMLRFIADIVSKQSRSVVNYTRENIIVSESRIFSIINANDPQGLVPDSIRLPATNYFDYYRAYHPLAHSYVNDRKARENFVLPKSRKVDPKESQVPPTPLDFFKKKNNYGLHPLCGIWTREDIDRMIDLSEYVRFLRNSYENEVAHKEKIYKEDKSAFTPRYKETARRCRIVKEAMEDTYEYLEQLETKFKLDINDLKRQLFREQMQDLGLLTDIRNTRPHWPARLCTNVNDLKKNCRNGICINRMSEEEAIRITVTLLSQVSRQFSWRKSNGNINEKVAIENLGTPEEIESAFKVYRDAVLQKTGVDIEELKTSSSSSNESEEH